MVYANAIITWMEYAVTYLFIGKLEIPNFLYEQ